VALLLCWTGESQPSAMVLAAPSPLGQEIPQGPYSTSGYFTREPGSQCKHGDCWAPQTPPYPVYPEAYYNDFVLYIRPNHQYQWGLDHGPYITRSDSSHSAIVLCGRIEDGSFSPAYELSLPSSPPNPEIPPVKYVMKREPKIKEDPPRIETANKPHSCATAEASPSGGHEIPGILGLPLLASLQPSSGQRRGVDGEFYLALRSHEGQGPPSKEDIALWDCLISGAYPRVMFVPEGGGVTETTFVWPDGHFRVVLDGGVTYSWRLIPSPRCPALRPQDDRGNIYVPPRPVGSAEKVWLGCVLADEGFNDCHAWWLHHP